MFKLPKKKDNLENPLGYPLEERLPEIKPIIGKYNNTLYTPNDITKVGPMNSRKIGNLSLPSFIRYAIKEKSIKWVTINAIIN